MLRKIVIFLIRKKLKLGIRQHFQFTNQRADNVYYYFTNTEVIKVTKTRTKTYSEPSQVSLNWVLDDNCKIITI